MLSDKPHLAFCPSILVPQIFLIKKKANVGTIGLLTLLILKHKQRNAFLLQHPGNTSLAEQSKTLPALENIHFLKTSQ